MKLILLNILIFFNTAFGQTDSAKNNHTRFGLDELINSALETNVQLEPIELEKKILSARLIRSVISLHLCFSL